MTPARARELAAAAGDLYHQLREADLARDADPDPARRRAGRRLDVAAGGLHSAGEELLDTAGEHGNGSVLTHSTEFVLKAKSMVVLRQWDEPEDEPDTSVAASVAAYASQAQPDE